MPCDYDIGVDYYKAYSHIVVQDTGGKTVHFGCVQNGSETRKQLIKARARRP